MPSKSWRKFFVREENDDGIMGHFGIDKNLEILEEQVYWPKIHQDVSRIYGQCMNCRSSKSSLLS